MFLTIVLYACIISGRLEDYYVDFVLFEFYISLSTIFKTGCSIIVSEINYFFNSDCSSPVTYKSYSNDID